MIDRSQCRLLRLLAALSVLLCGAGSTSKCENRSTCISTAKEELLIQMQSRSTELLQLARVSARGAAYGFDQAATVGDGGQIPILPEPEAHSHIKKASLLGTMYSIAIMVFVVTLIILLLMIVCLLSNSVGEMTSSNAAAARDVANRASLRTSSGAGNYEQGLMARSPASDAPIVPVPSTKGLANASGGSWRGHVHDPGQPRDSSREMDSPGGITKTVLGVSFLTQEGLWFDYITLMGSTAVCWFAVSVMNPYLNPWSQEHGQTPAQVGTILAVQPLVSCIAQVALPDMMDKIGKRNLLIGGLFLSGLALCIFGIAPVSLLHHGPSAVFGCLVASSVLVGVGSAVVDTCVFALLQDVFPKVTCQAVSHAEAWIGLGCVAGPALGGMLFQCGGFMLPPVAAAGLLWIFGVIAIALAPKKHGDEQQQEDLGPHQSDVWMFAASCVGICAGSFSMAFGTPLASDYWADEYKEPVAKIGVILGCRHVVYTIAVIMAGIVSDRGIMHSRCIFAFGALCAAIGITLLGWSGMPLAVSVGGSLLFGVAEACTVAPGMSLLNQSSPHRDSSFTAAIFMGSFNLGLGLGPLVGLPISNALGVASATCAIGICTACLSMVVAVILFVRPCPDTRLGIR